MFSSKTKSTWYFFTRYHLSDARYILCFLVILFSLCLSSQSQATSSYQGDYNAYLNSRYSNSNWNAYVREGMKAFHEGQFDIAQRNLYKAFNMGCESPLVLFQMALISEYQKSFYSALEYYQMAKANFKKANKGHRYHREFNENYGRALYYSGKVDQALPILKKAAKRTKSFWLLKMVGMLAFEKGDTLTATSYFERAVRIRSSEVTKEELVYIYTLLGRMFANRGERDGALRNYSKVLELDPENGEARKFVSGIRKTYQQDKMMDMLEELKNM